MCYATAVRARSREAGFPVFVRNVHAALLTLRSGAVLHVDGPPGTLPVLLFHGLGGGAWSWKPQREKISTSHRIYVWEARGHGSAARVADAGIADYYDAREALGAVLEETRRPAFLVGHSLGGLLAMRLACETAAAVTGLFLIEPGYHIFGKTPLAATAPFLAPLVRGLAATTLRTTFARAFRNGDRMEEAWPDQAGQVPFEYPSVFRDALTGAKGFEVRDFAKDIHDPTYLLVGTRVPRILRRGIRRLAATLREQLGEDFHYETVPGGHYLQLDAPDIVNDRLQHALEMRR